MDWAKNWTLTSFLALALVSSGCGYFLGDHPFSSLPKSKGKLDKTPRVEIYRGQDYTLCVKQGTETTASFFVYLLWMEPATLSVRAGGAWHAVGTGKSFTVRVRMKGAPGMLAYHKVEFSVGDRIYEETTVLVDCSGASAEGGWSTSDTVSSSVEAAGG